MAEAAVALAGVARRRGGGEQGREAQGEGGVGAVEGGHAAVAEAVSEPMIPGPGPARIASQPRRWRPRRGRRRAERLVLAAVGGSGGDVAAEQAALAQLGDIAGERARQGAAPGLHVADLEPRRRLAAAQAAGARWPWSGSTSTGVEPSSVPRGPKGATRRSTGSTGCWSEV